MNPLPLVVAQLRQSAVATLLIVLLVALSVALGIAASLLERGLRKGSAAAVDGFDLLVAAPGSQSQVVLTSIFLRPAALPLASGRVLQRLVDEPGVTWAAPVAFGDRLGRAPIVGTSAAFVTRSGPASLAEGRVFETDEEAVIGAAVPLALGAAFTPQHGAAAGSAPGMAEGHTHDGVDVKVVGRLKPSGTVWDRAILVPIEGLWAVHGLPTGHGGAERIGQPWAADDVPGIPVVVVKPRSVADAYRLRAKYRSGETMAFFPAEVLFDLYGALGDARELLTPVALGIEAVVVAAVLIAIAALLDGRRRLLAVLRALGASRLYVFVSIWLQASVVVLAGAALGLGAGWSLARLVAADIARRHGTALPVALGIDEVTLVAVLVAVGMAGAVLPALRAYRRPVADGLRG